MSKKPKFQLEITRIELNPEQAVLACCFDTVAYWDTRGNKGSATATLCNNPIGTRTTKTTRGVCTGSSGTSGYTRTVASSSTS